MRSDRAPGIEGWDINDPFTTLPFLNEELSSGDLCVVYYVASTYVPKEKEDIGQGPQTPSFGALASPRKPKVSSSSSSTLAAQGGEKKRRCVYFGLLGAVLLASN